MLFLPSPGHRERLDLVAGPLPPGLLPFLWGRGLGTLVLPENEDKAQRIAYDLFRLPEVFYRDNRLPHKTAHYVYDRRLIVVPLEHLYETEHNVFLHEVGHAVDHLYWDDGRMFSEFRETKAAIRVDKPLDTYCEYCRKRDGRDDEQFATAFAAYFCEPERNGGEFYHDITELSQEFIRIMRKYIAVPFSRGSDGRKEGTPPLVVHQRPGRVDVGYLLRENRWRSARALRRAKRT